MQNTFRQWYLETNSKTEWYRSMLYRGDMYAKMLKDTVKKPFLKISLAGRIVYHSTI